MGANDKHDATYHPATLPALNREELNVLIGEAELYAFGSDSIRATVRRVVPFVEDRLRERARLPLVERDQYGYPIEVEP